MLKSKISAYFLVALCVAGGACVYARDVLLEFKAAYFLPTGSRFKQIYHGSALYGPELTVQLCDDSCWYGFFSVDYFSKSGHTVNFDTPTKVTLVPLGFGLKYFASGCWCNCDYVNFYLGLGFQPVRVHTFDNSPYVVQRQTVWALGGIAKIGAYIDLSCDFLLDLFIDYSFAKAKSHVNQSQSGPVIPLSSSVSGAIFGGGLVYRF